VECCNIEEDSHLVCPLSWKGRIFGNKVGQTVDLLLDCDDNVEFGAQVLLLRLLIDVESLWQKNMMKYDNFTLLY